MLRDEIHKNGQGRFAQLGSASQGDFLFAIKFQR